jgi:hypothetical protein
MMVAGWGAEAGPGADLPCEECRVNAFAISLFFLRGSCYIVQEGFELIVLLPLPPKCWDYNLFMKKRIQGRTPRVGASVPVSEGSWLENHRLGASNPTDKTYQFYSSHGRMEQNFQMVAKGCALAIGKEITK